MTKQIISAFKVLALAIVLSFGLSYVYAWTAPTATPPNGNVSAPLNTSATDQIKTGKLTVGGLDAGLDTISTAGTMSGWTISANTLSVVTTITTKNLKVTNGAGTGKVLTSDATGNVSWKVPTAGSLSDCATVVAGSNTPCFVSGLINTSRVILGGSFGDGGGAVGFFLPWKAGGIASYNTSDTCNANVASQYICGTTFKSCTDIWPDYTASRPGADGQHYSADSVICSAPVMVK